MLELIWRFEIASLDDESVVRPLMTALEEVPGFKPTQYDLNQKGQWRPFDLDRTVVDALTQRTQLVQLTDEDQEQQALIALGKREEQPTTIVRLNKAAELSTYVADWPGLYEDLPMQSTIISSSEWRRALIETSLPPEITGDLLGMVFGWRRGAEPRGLDEIADEAHEEAPVRLEREANHLVLWLAESAEVEDDVHRRALERAARTLSRSGARS